MREPKRLLHRDPEGPAASRSRWRRAPSPSLRSSRCSDFTPRPASPAAGLYWAVLLLAWWPVLQGRAQQAEAPAYTEAGRPYVANFSARTYNAHQQNWAVAQDARGILYFGNLPGVLEYDGVSWRLIPTPNQSVVRSLALDAEGTVYVGAHAEFGYLAPDSVGEMRYQSLLEHVAPEDRAFNNVWKVHATPEGVYFRTSTHLFRWTDGAMQVWRPDDEFHRSFWVRDTFYIREWGRGLLQMVDGALRMAPGGERFADERVDVMLPFGEEAVLIGTRTDGLFRYAGGVVEPFATEADAFLREHQLYDGVMLADGTIALATLRGGVAVIDRQGRWVQRVDEAAGLQDNTVWALATDRQGGLWLALNKGLARVETPSPFTYFSEVLGVEGSVESIVRHRGRLYAATTLGVSYLAPATEAGSSARFRPVPGVASQAWSLRSVDQALLAATSGGIYQVEADRATQIADLLAFFLLRSRHDPDRVYVGLGDGLGLLRRVGGRWRFAGRLPGLTEEVRTIVEEEGGSLWLGTQFQGVLRVALPAGPWPADGQGVRIERYGQGEALPAGEVNVYSVDGRTVFGTAQGLRRFDPDRRLFVPDTSFGAAFADTLYTIHRVAQAGGGPVWIERGRDHRFEIGVFARQGGGAYEPVRTPLGRLSDFGAVWAIYPDASGDVVWLGGDEGLVRFDAGRVGEQDDAYAALVRRVKVDGDVLLHGAAPALAGRGAEAPSVPKLRYANYTLRFEYAAPRYDAVAANEYQYVLEGFDQAWSPWTRETIKDYTNLPEGHYRFRLRARDVYQRLGEEAAVAFTILPPWYRSWWAYVLYALPVLAVLYLVDRFQRRRLIAKERVRAEMEQVRLRASAAELQARTLHAERALLKSELKFLAVVESANDAVISADEEGRIVFWNRQAEAIFGYTQEEAMGMPLSVLMPERHRGPHERGLARFLASGEARAIGRILEVEGLRKDGSEFPVSLSLSTWRTDEGVFFGGILRDITRRKEDEEKLRTAQAQLAQAEKMASLGKLTAGVAHEIKNPLNFVTNFAVINDELAEELTAALAAARPHLPAATAGELEDLVAMIQANASQIARHGQRIDGIVQAMMQHASSGAGQHVPTDVNALVEEYVTLAYHGFKAQQPGADLVIARDYGTGVGAVELLPKGMGRVLLNLLENAFDAVRERMQGANGTYEPAYRPTVHVQTRAGADHVEIQIRDNGPGIPPEVQAHVFEPFFTTKPTGTGTGLGLSIAYDIVTHGHGGALTMQRTDGEGTAFIIALPRVASRQVEPDNGAQAEGRNGSET